MSRILLIEDDPAIIIGLEDSLNEEHYDVVTANDGFLGFQKAKNEKFDIIILDLMLPSKNGIDICKELRRDNIQTPILMLTSKKDEMDKILGLEIGADDYVTKPFSIRELQARIKVLLRRNSKIRNDIQEINFGNIQINFKNLEAIKNGSVIELSLLEFKILKYLAERAGEVISRDQLLDDVWGYNNFPTTRTVDNYILSLRKKIEDNPSQPIHIITFHKVGYKFMR
jgi:DNA-binding response OmpR family regulator